MKHSRQEKPNKVRPMINKDFTEKMMGQKQPPHLHVSHWPMVTQKQQCGIRQMPSLPTSHLSKLFSFLLEFSLALKPSLDLRCIFSKH